MHAMPTKVISIYCNKVAMLIVLETAFWIHTIYASLMIKLRIIWWQFIKCRFQSILSTLHL